MKRLLAILALGWTPCAFGSIAFVQVAQNGSAAGGTTQAVTFAQAVGTGNMVAVMVTWASKTITISSVTDNGTGGTWVTSKSAIVDSTNSQTSQIVYGYGWSAGPTTITVHFSASTGFPAVSAQEFSGQASGDPIDGTNYQGRVNPSGTSANSGTGTQTPSANNYLVFAGIGMDDSAAFGSNIYSAGTNFTAPTGNEHSTSGDGSVGSEYWIQTTATAVNASFSSTHTQTYTVIQAIFKVAGAGAACAPSRTLLGVSRC